MHRCRPARRRSGSAADGQQFSPQPRFRGAAAAAAAATRALPGHSGDGAHPAADPVRPLGCGAVPDAYRVACARHGTAQLPDVLRQLEDPMREVLRLSGAQLTLADIDSLEEVMRRRRWRRA